METPTKTYSMYWEVGAHTGFCQKITPTIAEAIKYGMYTCQFFMGNPQSFQRQKITEEDMNNCKVLLNHFPMNVFSHFPYVANFCGSIASFAWSGDKEQDAKTQIVLKNLEYELYILAQFNGKRSGVVIHPGAHKDRTNGLIKIAQSLSKINFVPNSKVLLENCAGEGNKLCKDFKEIKNVIDCVDKEKRKHIGVCIDTAHIWGQGDYDLRNCSEIDRMFTEFDDIIGLENFTLLHLNDSEVPLGSKKDRHACLGDGHIWGESFTSLIHLLNKCKENGIPMVLETHGRDMLTLAQIQPEL